MALKDMRRTCRAGLLSVKNDHMLNYEQVFGNVFEKRKSKCCAVLMKHRRKVKDKQVIIFQMDQQL